MSTCTHRPGLPPTPHWGARYYGALDEHALAEQAEAAELVEVTSSE
ncbi:hypothetical protein ACOQFL_16265 [Actinopolyspora sp. H202]